MDEKGTKLADRGLEPKWLQMMMMMMMVMVMVAVMKIRKRMRMVEQLISLAGTYGWGALARK